MDREAIEVLILAGVATGFVAGASSAGTTFAVAFLILVLPLLGVAGPDLGRIAGATSVIVPLTVRTFTKHLRRGSVDWPLQAFPHGFNTREPR